MPFTVEVNQAETVAFTRAAWRERCRQLAWLRRQTSPFPGGERTKVRQGSKCSKDCQEPSSDSPGKTNRRSRDEAGGQAMGRPNTTAHEGKISRNGQDHLHDNDEVRSGLGWFDRGGKNKIVRSVRRKSCKRTEIGHSVLQVCSRPGHFGKMAIVPDDTTKHKHWIMPVETFEALLATYCCTSEHWSFGSMSQQEGIIVYRRNCERKLAEEVAPRVRLNECQITELVPYSYFTVKSECYKEKGRVCEKNGHSCVRKIVAYTKWPKREAWRRAGRCIEKLVTVGRLGN